jgi:hypothetical protein
MHACSFSTSQQRHNSEVGALVPSGNEYFLPTFYGSHHNPVASGNKQAMKKAGASRPSWFGI